MSLQEVLASYDHITLSDDEATEAMIWAKQRKEQKEQAKERERMRQEQQKAFTSREWTFEQANAFMQHRAEKFLKKQFIIDDSNKVVYIQLCYYVCGLAPEYSEMDINKGILLCGNVGTGKTTLMNLFARNNRQCYQVINAKAFADEYQTDGVLVMRYYAKPIANPYNDPSTFYQPVSGLCIDDIGSEDIKQNFGNKANVIGDLIEKRYADGFTGPLLHGTTNLTAGQLKEYYGPRAASRMREIFNFIELPGNDRRR